MTNDHSDDHEKHSELAVTDVSESPPDSGTQKADVIDYLQDVNVALQDIINLFRTTLEALERSLSRKPDSPSELPDDLEPELSMQETGRVFSAKSKAEGVISVENGPSEAASDFLSKLHSLMEHTEKRVTISPIQQQERDRKLRHAVRSSGRTEMDIKSLKDSLSVQRTEHSKWVDKMNEELNRCLESSRQRAEEIGNEIRRIVNESEMEMVRFYKESVLREEILSAEIKSLETRLSDLRRSNILVEKELRDKRCRVENQLLDVLAKYDEEIGGRHREMENSAKEFELLNSQRKMLEEDVMINLRKVHDDLQKEKAEALQKILNERVEKFVRNRAARVIQKAWRAYWERHCAKKKKKSRKK